MHRGSHSLRACRIGICAYLAAAACGSDDNPAGNGGGGAALGATGGTEDSASGGTAGSGGSVSSGGTSGSTIGDAGGSQGDASMVIDAVVIEKPWCVAPSHSSTFSLASWAPLLADAGISWVRNFTDTESSLATANENGMSLSGILSYSSATSPGSFPVDDLPGWAAYVTGKMDESAGRIRYWEVWNEPPNFSSDKSPSSYAEIVKTGYDAAKAADPSVQIGLAAASVHLNFLDQAFGAGVASHFDYVTLHPYETLGLVDRGFEAQFMSIVPTVRKMLAARDPAHANVPVWFTEVGEPIDADISETHQADTLVKAYVMGMAQGAARICWFEALDGDSGPFGLIDSDGNRRPAYTALSTLVEHLGDSPRYVGWLLLSGVHYAFVFQGVSEALMVAWTAPGVSDLVTFEGPVVVVDPRTGATQTVESVELGTAPLVIEGVAEEDVALARANRERPFPWGGDFTEAKTVSYTAPSTEAGLHPTSSSNVVIIDGTPALDASGSPAQNFTVDPNFASYDTASLRITAVVRRNGTDDAGFNLKYEAVDGWKGTGVWYTVPAGNLWSTQSFVIEDTQFVGKWGYHFAFDSDSTLYSKYSIRSVTVEKL